MCPQSSGRWSKRRAARAERRDRTRQSPAEMTSTFMTTRSALGQVRTSKKERETETEGTSEVRLCRVDKEEGKNARGGSWERNILLVERNKNQRHW